MVSRGYGGKAAQYPLLLAEKTTTAEAGDEPVLIFQRTGAPVAVSPGAQRRGAGAAQRTRSANYHHRRWFAALRWRDTGEIVVIDGCRFGNGWWLPAGPMRERASRAKSLMRLSSTVAWRVRVKFRCSCVPGLTINLLTGERRDVSELH